jgi:hypothetical protein
MSATQQSQPQMQNACRPLSRLPRRAERSLRSPPSPAATPKTQESRSPNCGEGPGPEIWPANLEILPSSQAKGVRHVTLSVAEMRFLPAHRIQRRQPATQPRRLVLSERRCADRSLPSAVLSPAPLLLPGKTELPVLRSSQHREAALESQPGQTALDSRAHAIPQILEQSASPPRRIPFPSGEVHPGSVASRTTKAISRVVSESMTHERWQLSCREVKQLEDQSGNEQVRRISWEKINVLNWSLPIRIWFVYACPPKSSD